MTKLWAFLAMVGGLMLGFLKLFSMGRKSAQNEIKAKSEKTARKTETAANKAIIDGQANEAKINEDKIDTVNRDHFT